MATMLVVFLLSFSLASGFNYFSRCLLFNKTCVNHCPRFMHPYHTRCDKDAQSQRTCETPHTYPLGYTCGWSRCDCNGDLLLDEETQLCVEFESCTVVRHKKPNHLYVPKRKKPYRMPKKVVVSDDADLIDITVL